MPGLVPAIMPSSVSRQLLGVPLGLTPNTVVLAWNATLHTTGTDVHTPRESLHSVCTYQTPSKMTISTGLLHTSPISRPVLLSYQPFRPGSVIASQSSWLLTFVRFLKTSMPVNWHPGQSIQGTTA